MFVTNIVAVIQNLSCLPLLTYVPLSAIIQFFSRPTKCPGLYPWGYAYPRFAITVLECLGGSVQFNDSVIWYIFSVLDIDE